MPLLGKTQEKHPGDHPPTVPDLPPPTPTHSRNIANPAIHPNKKWSQITNVQLVAR